VREEQAVKTARLLRHLPSREKDIEPTSIIVGDGYNDTMDEPKRPSFFIKANI
jgi:hypothetical protein